MQKLVKKEYQIPFILVTSLFFLWGFAHAILEVLNKHCQDVMNISRAHSAWVQAVSYTHLDVYKRQHYKMSPTKYAKEGSNSSPIITEDNLSDD